MSVTSWLRRLPVRIRLVAAFIVVMVVVLTAAGGFVYWRVQVALDNTLNSELAANASTVEAAWRTSPDAAQAVAALPPDALAQVLSPSGQLLAHTSAATGLTMLTAPDVRTARTSVVDVTRGNVLTSGSRRIHIRALALPGAPGQPPDVAVVAVRIGQRDEALRELLAQLAAANLLALAAASLVGYRLARAALAPVERYRTRAQQITDGATGLRLDVPDGADDEVSRLGHTLNQMLAAQEHAAAAQRQFLADASHELRSPLTVLSSEVELALRRPRTVEAYQRTLEQITIETARLIRLADQLLDLDDTDRSRTEADAAADIWEAAQRAAARARSKNVDPGRSVTAPARPAGPHRSLLVPMSESALDQVLGNLADNAIVHGSGHVTITVSEPTAARGGERDVLVVTVSDEGEGPPADFVPHATERFRRADQARATPGNGLGLSLAHALVAAAGGELRLCSRDSHHRYPPTTFDSLRCTHPAGGTHVTALLPTS